MPKQIVVFKLNSEDFCVDINQVVEIIRLQTIIKVPDAPSFVEGITNLRGTVIPIIDLKKRFNLPTSEKNENNRIIVVNVTERPVGFIVDSVTEVLRVEDFTIQEAPDIIKGIGREYITSIINLNGRLIINLDLHKILTEKEKKEIEHI
ncbi:purine-binding chemotaxis protein CheW [Caldanaerobacter subterraneus subsp. tengcongensis MB4]|uniref:Chemotaxis signal transduction protein n=1 Tax=Caldanaerobacter subterraneus subsp. tengcongensis (strain DSM 15242 / JCM 11007 / NBRC 100824 / MB4) TaxID=273068 RepID=Q8RAR6_CALS4|nr:chemotaxis protein CheW [Caldanaerobacter subterraneus]AAM24371.1 Chemotaxis signal transduction protein [Caldanaerobacter subterraneus subsp. tengcongensis MB4]MBE3579682.1 purine-binding chemotaxis protein CheW [Caldanaerobacter subterraneus]MCS3916083.1 purine-binding chemotaxis protein CheW [Caldanaerobacter subterraneus subsp. tengcongensis MB4]